MSSALLIVLACNAVWIFMGMQPGIDGRALYWPRGKFEST